jgi:hypothetical protein
MGIPMDLPATMHGRNNKLGKNKNKSKITNNNSKQIINNK